MELHSTVPLINSRCAMAALCHTRSASLCGIHEAAPLVFMVQSLPIQCRSGIWQRLLGIADFDQAGLELGLNARQCGSF